MCLITFAYKSHPVYSLILLANRDEFYQRESSPLGYWDSQKRIVAGRDLLQGGTWLGLNDQGLFATVTNHRDGKTLDAQDLKSRGALTRDFLEGSKNATGYLQNLSPQQQEYGGFNLLLGDAEGIYHQSNRGVSSGKLSPGVYGLSNALLDTPWPKLSQVRQQLSNALQKPDIEPKTLLAIMQNPTQAEDNQLPDTGISYEWEKRLSSCFIRSNEYGTRATTILLQKPCGETLLIEQSYNAETETGHKKFTLQLPAIGSKDNKIPKGKDR